MCEYGSRNCTHYQEFGIDWMDFAFTIGLIRVDKPIQFGPMLKPICLPFGRNSIPELPDGSVLAILGHRRRRGFKSVKCVSNVSIERELDSDRIHFETNEQCDHVNGGPMMHQFAPQRMALEGILFYIFNFYSCLRCPVCWLNKTMEM